MEVLRGRQLPQAMHKLESLVHEGGRVQCEGLLFDLTVRVGFFQAVSLCACTLLKALLLRMLERANMPWMEAHNGELRNVVLKTRAVFLRSLYIQHPELFLKDWL